MGMTPPPATHLPTTATEKKFFEAIKNNQLQAAVSTILKAPDGKTTAITELADEEGMTALHWTVRNRNSAGVRWLMDKGADLELQDKKGRTPLKIALDNKDIRAMTLLIDNGARIGAALPGHDEELKGLKNTSDIVNFMIKTAALDALKPPPPAVVAPVVIDIKPEPIKIEPITLPLFRRPITPSM